ALGVFTIPVRVYWEDTDAGGVVYYASYLKFLERARSEWLRAPGSHQVALLGKERLQFVGVEANIRYHRPARFDDELVVSVKLEELRGASLVLGKDIHRGRGERYHLISATIRAACLASDSLRPRPLPKHLTA